MTILESMRVSENTVTSVRVYESTSDNLKLPPAFSIVHQHYNITPTLSVIFSDTLISPNTFNHVPLALSSYSSDTLIQSNTIHHLPPRL